MNRRNFFAVLGAFVAGFVTGQPQMPLRRDDYIVPTPVTPDYRIAYLERLSCNFTLSVHPHQSQMTLRRDDPVMPLPVAPDLKNEVYWFGKDVVGVVNDGMIFPSEHSPYWRHLGIHGSDDEAIFCFDGKIYNIQLNYFPTALDPAKTAEYDQEWEPVLTLRGAEW